MCLALAVCVLLLGAVWLRPPTGRQDGDGGAMAPVRRLWSGDCALRASEQDTRGAGRLFSFLSLAARAQGALVSCLLAQGLVYGAQPSSIPTWLGPDPFWSPSLSICPTEHVRGWGGVTAGRAWSCAQEGRLPVMPGPQWVARHPWLSVMPESLFSPSPKSSCLYILVWTLRLLFSCSILSSFLF